MPNTATDNLKKSIALNKKGFVRNTAITTAASLVAIEGAAIFFQGKETLEEEQEDFKKEVKDLINEMSSKKEILSDGIVNTNFSEITLQNNKLTFTFANTDTPVPSYDLVKCLNATIIQDTNGNVISAYDKLTKTLYVDGKAYTNVTEQYGIYSQNGNTIAKFNSDYNTFQIGTNDPFYAKSTTGSINFIKRGNDVVGFYSDTTKTISINDTSSNIILDNSILRDDLTGAKQSVLETVEAMAKNPKYNGELFTDFKDKITDLNLDDTKLLSYEDLKNKLVSTLDGQANIMSGKLGISKVTNEISDLGIFKSLNDVVGTQAAGIIGLIALSSVIIALLTALSAKTAETTADIYKDDLIKKKIITPEDVENKNNNKRENKSK